MGVLGLFHLTPAVIGTVGTDVCDEALPLDCVFIVPDETTTAPVLHAVIFASMLVTSARILVLLVSVTVPLIGCVAGKLLTLTLPDEITTAPVSQAVIFASMESVAAKISAEFASTT